MAVTGPRARRAVSLGAGVRVPILPATRRPPAPWRVRDALLIMGAGLGFLLTVLITSLGAVELQGGGFADAQSRETLSTLVSVGFTLFLLGMIHVFIVHRYHCPWRMLGLRPVAWPWLAAVPLIFALLTFSYVLMLRVATAVFGRAANWPQPLTTSVVNATHVPALELIIIVTNVFLTPLVEELLFRGVLYQALRRRMPVGSAILISALIFSAMHLSLVLFIPFTLMGIILAAVYERSGSLIPTILLHACNNGIILLVIAGNTTH
jgi:membrane protease YdiL (CAAX protease family)